MKFKNKMHVYNLLRQNVAQEIIVTGSTALAAYGLTDTADPYDLDLIVYRPAPETRNFFETLALLARDPEAQENYKTPALRDVGELLTLSFPGERGDFKVHVFFRTKRQQVMHYLHDGTTYPVALPVDIFAAKRTFGRAKDWRHLSDLCALILRGKK